MLTIKTLLAASPIHGLGVFAAERVEVGTTVWEFVPSLDRKIPLGDLDEIAGPYKEFFERHSNRDLTDSYMLICLDEARYINHSSSPNTRPVIEDGFQLQLVSNRVIGIGEEITENYYLIEANGMDMKNGRYVWDMQILGS